jgi:hypothetical protein
MCGTDCNGTWSGWSACPSPACGENQSNVFTVTQVPQGTGQTCQQKFPDAVGINSSKIGNSTSISRQCVRSAPGSCPVDRPCVARWVATDCDKVCGGGSTYDRYTVTDPGWNSSTNSNACTILDGTIQNVRACNARSCCDPNFYGEWNQVTYDCDKSEPEILWQRGILNQYQNMMNDDCVLTTITTTKDASQCEPRNPIRGLCNQIGYDWTVNGCVKQDDKTRNRVTACRSDTVTSGTCPSTGDRSYPGARDPRITWRLKSDGSTCEKTITCEKYIVKTGAAGQYIKSGGDYSTTSNDDSGMTDWSCDNGWTKSQTKGMCTPSASSATPTNLECPTLFTNPNNSQNKCYPSSRIPSKPSPNLAPPGVTVINTRSATSTNNVQINSITGTETSTITVNYDADSDYKQALIVISASFPGSFLSDSSQIVYKDISQGLGSFTIDTHISTWDMYLNKTIQIFNSTRTIMLSDLIEFDDGYTIFNPVGASAAR